MDTSSSNSSKTIVRFKYTDKKEVFTFDEKLKQKEILDVGVYRHDSNLFLVVQ